MLEIAPFEAWTDQIMDKVRDTATLAFPLENIIKKVGAAGPFCQLRILKCQSQSTVDHKNSVIL